MVFMKFFMLSAQITVIGAVLRRAFEAFFVGPPVSFRELFVIMPVRPVVTPMVQIVNSAGFIMRKGGKRGSGEKHKPCRK